MADPTEQRLADVKATAHATAKRLIAEWGERLTPTRQKFMADGIEEAIWQAVDATARALADATEELTRLRAVEKAARGLVEVVKAEADRCEARAHGWDEAYDRMFSIDEGQATIANALFRWFDNIGDRLRVALAAYDRAAVPPAAQPEKGE